jgi:hypothetical protein
MKNLIFFFWFMLPFGVSSQNNLRQADDYARISLNVFIPEQVEGIPAGSKSLLINKLTQAATKKGMAGGGPQGRFLLTANMDVLSKDVVPGAPNKHAYQFEVSLFIVDFIDKNIVSSTSFEVKGVGNNEAKAFTGAIRTIDLKNPTIDQFFDEGKIKIIEYFNSRCDFVIARAKALASQRQYPEAMNTLASIPEVSRDCYLKAMNEIGPIYKEFADYNCQILINVATSCWAARPNSEGAQLAGAVLSQIDPGSICYAESRQLISKMEQKVLKDENRDWKFIEKVLDNEVMLESLRIRAWRDVGVAWGKGQQPTYNDIIWIFR